MKNKYIIISKISLLLVFLVIFAGSTVRMTGSGMGCPDWPKCFGYYIPPTNIAELTWVSEKTFEKGQMIIYDDELKMSKKDFISGSNFNPKNWQDYTKHDYSIFNPLHTWVEFINRLIGVVCGISVLILGFYCIASQNNFTIEEFIDDLDLKGESYPEFREQIKKELIIQRVQRGKVGGQILITDQELEAFLETDEAKSELLPEVLVKQILVKSEDQIMSLKDKILEGENFSELA